MTVLIDQLVEARARAWEAAKEINERSVADGADGTLSAEDQATWDKANTDIDALDSRVKALVDAEQRSRDLESALKPFGVESRKVDGDGDEDGEAAEVRKFLTGETRSLAVAPKGSRSFAEARDLSKLSAGAGLNTVKVSFHDQLVAHMIEVSGVLNAGPMVLQTASGEQIQVPKTTSHSTAALISEAGTLTESDPAFGQVPLDAYKYAFSVQVSTELVTDTSVDLLGYLAMQAGRACGNALGAHLVTGTGSSQPNGVVTAATTGVTGGTGVAGAFTADNLVDLFYSVIAPYRNSKSCGWLMKDQTLGAVRKLKDTTNQYIWQPSYQAGAPDVLLGKPVFTDPNVAAPAVNAKSVVFGDFAQYYVRLAGGFRFERSDEFAFQNDLVTFRAILRGDGDLVDTTGAVKVFVGAAT